MTTHTDEPAARRGQSSLSIGDAARVLGVSTRTIRRWEVDGRIVAVRTEGGHRRFPIEVITELHRSRELDDPGREGSDLRQAKLPAASLPALERLLANRAELIVNRTTRHMYAEHRPGWFRSAAASQAVRAFLETMASSAKSGDWPGVLSATAVLFARAASSQSATYQEAFLFLRTLRTALIVELRAQDPAAPLEIARLFEALEQEAARGANRFFVADSAQQAGQDQAAPQRQPPIRARAAQVAERACAQIAAMPACEAALVLAGAPTNDHLDLIASAGAELEDERSMFLSDDDLSNALTGSSAVFLHLTHSVELLPIRSPAGPNLPIVSATEIPDRLRVATIILVAAGVAVESTMLAPLADLNLRLASLLAGSSDGDVDAELERIRPHLGG
jgi:excisionase family DNA binding protein